MREGGTVRVGGDWADMGCPFFNGMWKVGGDCCENNQIKLVGKCLEGWVEKEINGKDEWEGLGDDVGFFNFWPNFCDDFLTKLTF